MRLKTRHLQYSTKRRVCIGTKGIEVERTERRQRRPCRRHPRPSPPTSHSLPHTHATKVTARNGRSRVPGVPASKLSREYVLKLSREYVLKLSREYVIKSSPWLKGESAGLNHRYHSLVARPRTCVCHATVPWSALRSLHTCTSTSLCSSVNTAQVCATNSPLNQITILQPLHYTRRNFLLRSTVPLLSSACSLA